MQQQVLAKHCRKSPMRICKQESRLATSCTGRQGVLLPADSTAVRPHRSRKVVVELGWHVRWFVFLGGTSQILVPDNLHSGVTKALCYEPD